MLHEILLSLAGGPSPLLSSAANKPNDRMDSLLHSLLSPAEQALLRSLAQDLGQKSKDIRTHASNISATHPSTVCRAVCTTIIWTYLARFQERILAVERDILEENASIVGAYNIVPLSAVAGAFDGWSRKLDWLWRLVQFIQTPEDSRKSGNPRSIQTNENFCTAARVIGYLRDSIHTGYPDIEAIARDLTKAAETAFLKQVSGWILYGRYPANGDADFFVTRRAIEDSSSVNMYDIQDSLIPPFVSKATAHSILFIGKSLNHIRDRQSSQTASSSIMISPELNLLSNHLSRLSSLEYPLGPSSFSAAIAAIRLSLSQNALQKLLPISKVLEVLHILKDFFLLARGEFAVALITSAEGRLSSRNKAQKTKSNLSNDLASITIKEGEVGAVLARTWTTLASLQSFDDEDVDEELDLARDLISLSIKTVDDRSEMIREATLKGPAASFDDLLLPASTVLSLHVPSPLDLFLTSSDIDTYSQIHSYLLAIRRAHLRLSRLSTLSVLRREHPSPKLPSSEACARMRAISDRRTKSMRPVWAAIGSAVFFLTELGEYFQGEVIQSSWSTFHSWLVPNLTQDDNTRMADPTLLSPRSTKTYPQSSRPTSSRLVPGAGPPSTQYPHDPETLTQAHRQYLASLRTALLLVHATFTHSLRRLMTSIDHLCGLMQRLDVVQQSLNAEALLNGHEASGSHSSTEDRRIMGELDTSRLKLANGVQGLIEALRSIDAARAAGRGFRTSNGTVEENSFVPWNGGGVDRLLLKFDYGNGDELALR